MFQRMQLSLLAVLLVLSVVACNQSDADEVAISTELSVGVDGKSYGAEISEMSVTPIADIVGDPDAFDGKTVRVEGMVLDVCQMRGCWFEIAGENAGEKLRFKVVDGEMVFPMTAKGEYAVAQGTVVVEQLTVEETRERLQHHAEEMGEEFDPASVTEGEKMFRIQGTGAVIGSKK